MPMTPLPGTTQVDVFQDEKNPTSSKSSRFLLHRNSTKTSLTHLKHLACSLLKSREEEFTSSETVKLKTSFFP
jgi:hypothetical protein